MDPWAQMAVTVVGSVLASSGLWALIMKKVEKKESEYELLKGIAHDRLLFLGMHYIERGYITEDEYDNLYNYIYLPYKKVGGNGTIERIIKEVDKLPIKKSLIEVED